MKSYQLIGLMSGTSLDGLDVVYARFQEDSSGSWSFNVLDFHTFPYPNHLVQQLENVFELTSSAVFLLDLELGQFYAEQVNQFIKLKKINTSEIDAIACHGQTIIHQPDKKLTVQIGCGETLAFQTGIKVINDFRTKDVLAGGQGAPLVPIGDQLLFGNEADAFLNIGGFANVSFKQGEKVIAFDICPGNLPLNRLVKSKNLSYDKDGNLARSGQINFFLLDLLNELEYYQQEAPKSLGTEWLEHTFYPLIKLDKEIENNLRTVIEHIAIQINDVLTANKLQSVYITGGGALNTFLIERLEHYFKGKIIVPNKQLIECKEALIFAFLGVLFLEKKPNSIASVTGASKDVIGGVLHLP